MSTVPHDADSIKLRIAELQLEHRGLNQMIERMVQEPDTDQLLVRRLKKRKLQIKDSMFIIDSDGAVFQVRGGLQRVSTPQIEERIRRSILIQQV